MVFYNKKVIYKFNGTKIINSQALDLSDNFEYRSGYRLWKLGQARADMAYLDSFCNEKKAIDIDYEEYQKLAETSISCALIKSFYIKFLPTNEEYSFNEVWEWK